MSHKNNEVPDTAVLYSDEVTEQISSPIYDSSFINVDLGVDAPPNQPEPKESNLIGILSIVFGFLLPIVGLILGLLGILKAPERKDGKDLRNLSAAGITVSFVMCIIYFIIVFILYTNL